MGRRNLGTFLLGLGAVLIAIGVAASRVGGSTDSTEATGLSEVDAAATTEPPTTVTAATTVATSPDPAPSTSTAPSTQPATTSTTTPTSTLPTTATTTTTTTTTTTMTTTTLPPEGLVAGFILEFGAAINDGDVAWLLERLHPAMILGYGGDVCRGFIQDEILLLRDYSLRGAVTGPVTKTLETGVGSVTVDGIYEAEISFVFQGQTIDAAADFVPEGETTWLAACR